MTDYSAVEAGTQTDILVAEHVMGWTPWLDERAHGYVHVVWRKPGEPTPWEEHRSRSEDSFTRITGADIDTGKHINHLQHFAPSRDWQAFGDLMERLMAENTYVHIEGWREEANDDYVVTVESLYEATADDLRLAVCRAALAWADDR